MSGKEVIPFSVKGPIPVQVGGTESRGSSPGQIGCAIIDLNFQYPSQIGELVLSNYYTAWLSVYVKRMSSKLQSFGKVNDSAQSGKHKGRPHFSRSFSTDFSGNNSPAGPKLSKKWLSQSSEEQDEVEYEQGVSKQQYLTNEGFNTSPRRKHNNCTSMGGDDSSAERPWELSIECKTLMLSPHFEYGSQDIISIPATEALDADGTRRCPKNSSTGLPRRSSGVLLTSLISCSSSGATEIYDEFITNCMVEWRNVRVIRLVIYQPSTVWKRFSLEDINVFRDLPKRGFSHCDDLSRQRDNWFSVLKKNVKTMLGGQLVEPENNTSDDEVTA